MSPMGHHAVRGQFMNRPRMLAEDVQIRRTIATRLKFRTTPNCGDELEDSLVLDLIVFAGLSVAIDDVSNAQEDRESGRERMK